MPAVVKSLPASVVAALAAYDGPVTRADTRAMNPRLSASKLVRYGHGPAASDWRAQRRAARRERRAEREAALA